MRIGNQEIPEADVLKAVAIMKFLASGENPAPAPEKDPKYVNALAVYLLALSGRNVSYRDGTEISKSAVDEITLDFTRGRTLTEEEATEMISFIFNQSSTLSMYNSRVVNKLVVPIDMKSARQENLISPEQKGGAVTANNHFLTNFGIDLRLRNVQLRYDIPLQTVKNNLYKPGWETEVINDIATVLANDILLLATYGLGDDYASTSTFYHLGIGFEYILRNANGKNTNTYGSVKVVGFNGKYLTPSKVDATGCTGSNYTAGNLISLMRKMKKAIPLELRGRMGNLAWIMSAQDADLYFDARSESYSVYSTTPVATNNTYRETLLTTGQAPSFLGFPIYVHPYKVSINETHHSDTTNAVGSIILGDLKAFDIVASSADYNSDIFFSARADTGSQFEHTYNLYLDFMVNNLMGTVVAFKGAKCETPVCVTPTGNQSGSTGEFTFTTPKYVMDESTKFFIFCDTPDSVIYKSTTSSDLADSAPAAGATLVGKDEQTSSATTTYYRAYKVGTLIASTIINIATS